MLTEVKDVKQIDGEPRRRWFADDEWDLIIWYGDSNNIIGFQLCYDKNIDEHAFTWKREQGGSHSRVDDGENRPGEYKASPILVRDGIFDSSRIISKLKASMLNVDKEICGLVIEELKAKTKTEV